MADVDADVVALRTFLDLYRHAAQQAERQRQERQLYENLEKMMADGLDETVIAAAFAWMREQQR